MLPKNPLNLFAIAKRNERAYWGSLQLNNHWMPN